MKKQVQESFVRLSLSERCFNHLTSLYRDVPKVFNVLTTETSQVPKSQKSEIVADIIKDLKDITAEGMLPITADRGRATRGAALGLLARVYLYNEMYKEAADAALQVINLSQYEIDPNYSTLFTEAGGASKEIVFAIRFKNTDQQNGEGGFLAYNYGYPMEWQLPYPNLANDFYCKDGKPITSSGIYDPDDDSTRDPRLTYTLMTKNGDTYDGKVSDAWWSWNSPFQLFMRKYQNEVLLVVVNFDKAEQTVRIQIPDEAFKALDFGDNKAAVQTDLMTGENCISTLTAAWPYQVVISAYSGSLLKFTY